MPVKPEKVNYKPSTPENPPELEKKVEDQPVVEDLTSLQSPASGGTPEAAHPHKEMAENNLNLEPV